MSNLENMVAGNEIHTTAMCLHHCVKTRLGFILDRPNLALCCAALDPRYGHLGFISTPLRDQVWDTLAHWVVEYEDIRPERVEPPHHVMPLPNEEERISYQQASVMLNRFRTLFESPEQADRLQAVQDPLEYWAAVFQTRPENIMLKFLILCLYCIPASSAPSERVFSKAGLELPRLRSRMMPDTLEDLVLLSEWTTQSVFDYDRLLDDYVELMLMHEGE